MNRQKTQLKKLEAELENTTQALYAEQQSTQKLRLDKKKLKILLSYNTPYNDNFEEDQADFLEGSSQDNAPHPSSSDDVTVEGTADLRVPPLNGTTHLEAPVEQQQFSSWNLRIGKRKRDDTANKPKLPSVIRTDSKGRPTAPLQCGDRRKLNRHN